MTMELEAGARARVIRALAVSGRRMFPLPDGSGWGIVHAGDRRRRPVLKAGDALVRAMAADGELVEAAGGGWVVAGPVAGAAGPAEPLAPAAPRSRLGGAGFAALALKAARGEGSLTVREAAAGRRLVADAEASLRLRGLSMNWDAVPADGGGRAPGGGGGGPGGLAAMAARQRLERLRGAAGDRAFDLAWAACVEGLPLAALERRFGLAKRSAARRLSQALEKLADAYEGRERAGINRRAWSA